MAKFIRFGEVIDVFDKMSDFSTKIVFSSKLTKVKKLCGWGGYFEMTYSRGGLDIFFLPIKNPYKTMNFMKAWSIFLKYNNMYTSLFIISWSHVAQQR